MIWHKVIEGRHYVRQVEGGSVYVHVGAGIYEGQAHTSDGENSDLKVADYVTVPLVGEIVAVSSFASEADLDRLQDRIGTQITHEITLEAWLVRLALENNSRIWIKGNE